MKWDFSSAKLCCCVEGDMLIYEGTELPNEFYKPTEYVYIYLNLSNDLDITDWLPSGIVNGGQVSIIRTDTSNAILSMNQNGISHKWNKRKGEIMTIKFIDNQKLVI